MIKMTLPNAFMLYLGGTLAVLLFFWIYHNLMMRKKKLIPYERRLLVCEYCSFSYLEELFKAVTQCPQCHSFNKKKDEK